MDITLVQDATTVDETTMAVPQPVPDPVQINKDALVARMADRAIAMQGLQDADAIDQALLAKANDLGLKTTAELAITNTLVEQ